jgi:hypothetical protein
MDTTAPASSSLLPSATVSTEQYFVVFNEIVEIRYSEQVGAQHLHTLEEYFPVRRFIVDTPAAF